MSAPRGLTNFIRDIRNCASKEDERKRVNLELANIRTKFKQSDKLSSYDRKKYVWKLLYIYMLGYEVEFGHMEAVSLMSSTKYAEKQVGYMVTSVLLNESHEFLRLVINSIKNDITSRNDTYQSLGLVFVANVGGREFAESLAADVQRLLMSSSVRPVVRKKAALCLLRLFRRNPDVLNKEDWADAFFSLLDERDLGLLTSVLSFLQALVATDAVCFRSCASKVVRLLERLASQQGIPQDYMYYGVPSPWLQIKCMRVLQQFPLADDPSLAGAVAEVLRRIVSAGGESIKNVNKSNAIQAVMVEAVGLVMVLDRDLDLVDQTAIQLGRFISAKEPNTKYLGLENMGRMSAIPQVAAAVKRNQQEIADSLHDADISIRRRALDLLFGMCDPSNAQDIVQQLLDYLVVADFAIREELVLKIAILAEKFAPAVQQTQQHWYIDVMLTLVDKAGDFVSDDVWHRIVQIVTNTPDLQRYAAEQTLGKLQAGGAHEALVKVAGYILGEFGHLQQEPCTEYFALLQQRFPACSLPTKALLLSAYAKLVTHTTDIGFAEQVKKVFQRYHAYADVELQQRSVEYFAMAQYHVDKLKEVLAPMPVFPERTSALERRVAGDAADQAQVPPSSRVSMPPVVSHSLLAEPALPQAAPVPAQSAFDALDLLMGSAAPAHPAPAAPMAGSTFGGLDDLLGLGALAPPAQHVTSVKAVPLQDPAVLLRALALKDKGVLWEDRHLQLGVTADFIQHTGHIGLFLGNKHTAPLTRLRADVHGVDGLRVALGAVPPSVAEGQQATVQLTATCTAPYQQQPSLAVSYTLQDTQQEVAFTVTLPLTVTKYLQAAPPMEKSLFYQGWSRMTGSQKLEAVVLPGPSLTSTSCWHTLFAGLRLHVLPDVDPNPANVFAASVLCSESGQPLCVVRWESGPQKLTVASPSPALAAAVKACIMPLIG